MRVPSTGQSGMDAAVRILAVDDDPDIRRITQAALDEAGYEVWTAPSGAQALQIIEQRGLPHLCILDIIMPGMDGLQVAEQIQSFSDLPIIMLTAVDEEQTVIDAIERYAEDYVTKPFSPDVLVVRVRRLLRRMGDFSYTSGPQVDVDKRLSVDFGQQRVYLDGKGVKLTPTETKLLFILMRNAGRTVRNDFLLARLWPLEEVYEDTLRVHVYRLRNKIEPSPGEPRYVLTDRGKGYRFPPQPSR